jgi:hypothetical protein
MHDFDVLPSAHGVGRAMRTPTRAEPLNRPPRKDADDQHRRARWSAGEAEQYLEAWTAKALAPHARQPSQVLK